MIYRTFIICLFLVFTYGCSDSNNDDGFDLSPVDPPANPIQPANPSQPEWLYVQTAATAQMTSDTTLEIPFIRDVFAFTDRPNREHAYFTAFEFASLWTEEGANSFSEDPPNAVLTWLVGEEQREAEITIDSATVYADGTQESLVYEVTLETEQMPDAQMSYVSLFVDSNDASATSGVEVCFSATEPEGACLMVLLGDSSEARIGAGIGLDFAIIGGACLPADRQDTKKFSYLHTESPLSVSQINKLCSETYSWGASKYCRHGGPNGLRFASYCPK